MARISKCPPFSVNECPHSVMLPTILGWDHLRMRGAILRWRHCRMPTAPPPSSVTRNSPRAEWPSCKPDVRLLCPPQLPLKGIRKGVGGVRRAPKRIVHSSITRQVYKLSRQAGHDGLTRTRRSMCTSMQQRPPPCSSRWDLRGRPGRARRLRWHQSVLPRSRPPAPYGLRRA